MIWSGLILGFLYGYISSKGQFCMNSGFSNVARKKDTTKLKSYLTAILIQMAVLPALLSIGYFYPSANLPFQQIAIPDIFLVGNIIGGFLFGIFMYYAGGCGAGIFYKIGEKNSSAIIAVIGFTIGIFITEKAFLFDLKTMIQQNSLLKQRPIWQFSPWMPLVIASFSFLFLGLLMKLPDKNPGNAEWSWKKTGISIGLLGVVAWLVVFFSSLPFGMSIIPGVFDMATATFSWAFLFVIGLPFGAYWSIGRKNNKAFQMPTKALITKRLFGGLGLGITGSIAAGCTLGHGLTFAPLLAIGSILSILAIFSGSFFIGYLTK